MLGLKIIHLLMKLHHAPPFLWTVEMRLQWSGKTSFLRLNVLQDYFQLPVLTYCMMTRVRCCFGLIFCFLLFKLSHILTLILIKVFVEKSLFFWEINSKILSIKEVFITIFDVLLILCRATWFKCDQTDSEVTWCAGVENNAAPTWSGC